MNNEFSFNSQHKLKAVLGPTNTGKTHLAIERMLGYQTGIIGLPLRLLAREVYQRLCQRVGSQYVSLVTGEEKIITQSARYFVFTVEALPRSTDVDFVAIDEVQLAADFERGHVFTDRILHLRGRYETMLLGAATMRPILETMLPGLQIDRRPRFSKLQYSGVKKITQLSPRSAIVAFTNDEVYAIAELMKRQHGGAALVMGALSPRTRNAQVALYQSGEVDFLIATDAIGMGLNLDVDHVAFAQLRKFDGYHYRDLTPAELGQIAGRAGRHMRDGTFGVTANLQNLPNAVIETVESHTFPAVRVLQWRTPQFDFSTLPNLLRSIATPPPREGLVRALPATDAQTLDMLSRDHSITKLADNSSRIALLWEACALPDYRKISPQQHGDIVAKIYRDLVMNGAVDETYLADQVAKANRSDGNIDALSQRIAAIRTWTFVAHRSNWLSDQRYWQEKTRQIEDILSDALHERLTKRFVDRRTSILIRRLRENVMMDAEISQMGDVFVEGQHVGKLDGFRFHGDVGGEGVDAKAIRSAAQKVLTNAFEQRANRFASCPNADLTVGSDGIIRWIGQPVASLAPTENILKPRAILLADEQLNGVAREQVVDRIERFTAFHFSTALKPLFDLHNAEALTGLSRGIAFQLVEHFGIIPRREIATEVKGLDQISRAALRRLGVRFGAFHIFLPMMLKPAPAHALTLLYALHNDGRDVSGYGEVVSQLAAGRTSLAVDPTYDKKCYQLAGYRIVGSRAVRVDILERLADLIRPTLSWKPGNGPRPQGAFDGRCFYVTPAMLSILGATALDMEEILRNLGYRSEKTSFATFNERLAELDLLLNKNNMAAVPAAEPVGLNWDKFADQHSAYLAAHRDQSEQKNRDLDANSEDKDILLWHFKTRGDQIDARAREPKNTRRTQERVSRDERHARSGRNERSAKPGGFKQVGGKPKTNNKSALPTTYSKTTHKEKKRSIDPDSPFAALSVLRDQLGK